MLAALVLSLATVPRPNVLVVVLDDVGRYDYDHIATPNLHALARAGLECRRAYAMPACAQARSSLMFGVYGKDTGDVCGPPGPRTPDVDWFSLPKCFEQKAYSTAFLGKWHLGTNALGRPWEETPRLHGFDQVVAGLPQNLVDLCGLPGVASYEHWARFDMGPSFVETRYQTTVVRNEFMRWWSQVRGPKFAYLSFQAAHSPFHDPPGALVPNPPSPVGLSENRRRFEAMVMSVDTVLGQIAQVIDLRNTYVVLMGDNGTPPNAAAPGQQANELKTTVFEGGVRVPFFVVGPGIAPGVSDSLVSLVDVLPTLAEQIGVGAPAGLDGRSLVPLFADPTAVVRDHVFVAYDDVRGLLTTRHRAVIQARYKLRRANGAETFYDLASDPAEDVPLAAAALDAAVVQELRDEMAGYLARGF